MHEFILSPKDIERFWAKVAVAGSDECWEWQAAIYDGYGQFLVGRRCLRSHRIAYTLTHGPIPKGKCVCHSCDNRKCCNPAHLWRGTRADNNADKLAKGRLGPRHGEHNGRAKLSNEDVASIRSDSRPSGMLATQYGVSRETIWQIRAGRTWSRL